MKANSAEEAAIVQAFGTLKPVRLDLSDELRQRSVAALNRLLAHSMAMRDLYKKAHWQTSGPGFYALHLLFDKHHQEHLQLIDQLAERVQTLGGVALALAQHVVEESRIALAPRGREAPQQQLLRLVAGHELVLKEARALARRAAEGGDDGTADLIIGAMVRTYELQSWFLSEHLSSLEATPSSLEAIYDASEPLASGADPLATH